eukprot:gene20350-24374_t
MAARLLAATLMAAMLMAARLMAARLMAARLMAARLMASMMFAWKPRFDERGGREDDEADMLCRPADDLMRVLRKDVKRTEWVKTTGIDHLTSAAAADGGKEIVRANLTTDEEKVDKKDVGLCECQKVLFELPPSCGLVSPPPPTPKDMEGYFKWYAVQKHQNHVKNHGKEFEDALAEQAGIV